MLWLFCKIKSIIKKHIGIFAVIVIYYTVAAFLKTTCLIKYVTGYNCPACGMTRAMLSLLKGDWYGYLSHNAMALPVVLALLIIVHNRFKRKLRFFVQILCVVILIMNMIYFIFRNIHF